MAARRDERSTRTRRDDAVRITTAAEDPREDQRRRQKRYLMSMSLRTICFVGAILIDHPIRWFLVAGAIFLPYIAVVLANAAATRRDDFRLDRVDEVHPELTGRDGVRSVGPGVDPGRG